jgi:hypothetical protein
MIQHSLCVGEIRRLQLGNTFATGAVIGLGKNAVLPLYKGGEFFQRTGLTVKGLSVEILGEAVAEAELVIKFLCIAVVVHELADLLVADTGQVGVPFFPLHIIEAEHDIVIVTGTVTETAPDHGTEGAGLGMATLILDGFQHGVQLVESHSTDHASKIFDTWHSFLLGKVLKCNGDDLADILGSKEL